MAIMDIITNMAKSFKHKKIRQAIQDKYAEVSITASGKFSYPTGKAGAEALGYDPKAVQDVPKQLLESFCGVGNPFFLGEISPGESVLDIGCGAGFDLFVASRRVGADGQVYGIDMTAAMVEKAKRNLVGAQIANADVRVGNVEKLPFADDMFDVVISNGALNLSPCKRKAFGEIYRVLKPGGRFQFADIVLGEKLPPRLAGSADAWSQ